ncbi:MAG: hypothetical protein JWO71_606 [Candidatus Acidoferrum typicum]|nr:hypothetical protein [Candidatus Acidoferrum typicum]
MADKITFECQEQDCGFSTMSETKFVSHLIDVHAFRPGQVGRVLAKIEKQIAQRMPSGFQTVIDRNRIYIKRSRTRYSAYTYEMRESNNNPVPMNPPSAEQETAVRDHDGNIIDGKTVQEVKDKLSKIRTFELE